MSEAYDNLVAAAETATDETTPKAYLVHRGFSDYAWILGEREQGITTLWDGGVVFIPWSNIKYVTIPDTL